MTQRRSESGSVSVGIFGLMFAAFSLAFAWSVVGDELRTAWRLRHWVEAPALLVEVSGHPRGMGVRYRYRYAGRDFEGTRVGFYDRWSGGESNAPHSANYRSLRSKLEASGPVRAVPLASREGHALRSIGTGAPIQVWLDPDNPAEAVIDPTIRWERLRMPMIIVGALVAAGLAVAALGFFGLRGASSAESAAAMCSRRPIRGSSYQFPVAGWTVGIGWCAMVAVPALNFRPVPGNELLARLALGAFAVVGFYILWRSALATLRWRRYGAVVLELDPYPGEAGGVVAGTLLVPIRYHTGNRFKLVLRCQEFGQHGGELRKNNSFQRTLYEEEHPVRTRLAASGTRIEFSIDVPPDAPGSDGHLEALRWTQSIAQRVYVRWTLDVSAEVEGVDLQESFEIPVRRVSPAELSRRTPLRMEAATLTPSSSAAVGGRPTGVASATRSRTVGGGARTVLAPAADRARTPAYLYERSGRRIRITQPAWRKPIEGLLSPLNLILGLGPSAGFVAAGWFLLSNGQWLGGAVFFLIGSAVLLAFVGYLAHALAVDVDDDSVTIERRLFGLRFKRVTLAREDIAAVEAQTDSDSRGGILLREIRIRLRNGKAFAVADMIPKAHDAEVLRSLLAAALGVENGGSAIVAPQTQRAAEPTQRPAKAGVKIAAAVVLLSVGLQGWPLLREVFDLTPALPDAANRANRELPSASESRRPAQTAPPRIEPQQQPPLDADDWRGHFNLGRAATIGRRPQDAVREYRAALAIVERMRGANDPVAAMLLDRISDVHVTGRNYAQAEPMLRRALAILEGHSDAAVRAEAGKLVLGFDRERVLRSLGWALWELRRYPESLAHYQRAYDLAVSLDIDEANRNRRLAYSSAGIMAGACTQREWERADRAMAELKHRLPRVAETDRRWLEYWVRTGEPRLAARNC